MAGTLTPYALALFKGQLQQSTYYTSAKTGAADTFTVTRKEAPAGPSQAPALLDVEEAAADADFGLTSVIFASVPRQTTLNSCSCQFTNSTGLPCRHILHLCTTLQKDVPLGLLHVRWHVRDPTQRQQLVEALLRCKPARGGAASADTAPLTRDDRYQLLVSACRGLCEVGASSDALYKEATGKIAQACIELRGGAAADAGGVNRRQGRSAEGRSRQG